MFVHLSLLSTSDVPGTVLDVKDIMATDTDTILVSVMEPFWPVELPCLLSLYVHLFCFLFHVLRCTVGR